MPRRDPSPQTFQEACKYLESQGFKLTVHRFGPKCRIDLGWPDDRRGIRLPEWRIVQIADEWRAQQADDSQASHSAPSARQELDERAAPQKG